MVLYLDEFPRPQRRVSTRPINAIWTTSPVAHMSLRWMMCGTNWVEPRGRRESGRWKR